MTETARHDAIRDSRALFRSARRWAHDRLLLYLASTRFWLVIGVSVVTMGFAGPFDTLSLMGLGARLMYWALVLPAAILLQFFLSMWLREYARKTGRPWGLAALIAGVAGCGPILLWVAGINAVMLKDLYVLSLPTLASYVFPVVVPLTVTINAFLPGIQPLWGFRKTSRTVAAPEPAIAGHSQTEARAITARAQSPVDQPAVITDQPSIGLTGVSPLTASADPSPFFGRLPGDLGRDIVCIKAANHVLQVTTRNGVATVRMRLTDAEAELSALPGLRVHRSWWVNLRSVVSTQARTGGYDLVLDTGLAVPVSRAQQERVLLALDLVRAGQHGDDRGAQSDL